MCVAAAEQLIAETETSRLENFLLGRIADERRHRRVAISLPVRFMADDSSEHRGLLFDMSVGGISVTAETRPPVGSRIVLYIDEIGRSEGTVARHHEYGFAVRLSATQNRRDKLAERLMIHANRHRLHPEDLRAHERVEIDQDSRCVMPDGKEAACRVLDLSLSGAALAVEHKLVVGADISIGRMRGRVVRHIPGGVAIKFLTAQTSHQSALAGLKRA